MKKILALALAILMIVSLVTLTSCSKEEEKPDDDYEYNGDNSGDTSKNGTDSSNDRYRAPAEDEWVTKSNYSVWVAADGVRLRKGPSQSDDVVAVLNAGTKLVCTRTSENWNEVKYDAGSGEALYYISAQYTENAPDFEFDACDPVALSIKVDGDKSCTVNLRTIPFITDAEDLNTIGIGAFDASALNGKDANGNDVTESLTLVGISKSKTWYKVTYTGTWQHSKGGAITTYTDAVFYLRGNADVTNAVIGLPTTGASSGATRG